MQVKISKHLEGKKLNVLGDNQVVKFSASDTIICLQRLLKITRRARKFLRMFTITKMKYIMLLKAKLNTQRAIQKRFSQAAIQSFYQEVSRILLK